MGRGGGPVRTMGTVLSACANLTHSRFPPLSDAHPSTTPPVQCCKWHLLTTTDTNYKILSVAKLPRGRSAGGWLYSSKCTVGLVRSRKQAQPSHCQGRDGTLEASEASPVPSESFGGVLIVWCSYSQQ